MILSTVNAERKVITSLDVQSVFTILPINEVLDMLEEISHDDAIPLELPVFEVCKLTRFYTVVV